MPDEPLKKFPVLVDDEARRKHPTAPTWVPWDMVAPCEGQLRRNHPEFKSLAAAAADGLCPVELLAILDRVAFPRDTVLAHGEAAYAYAVGQLNKRIAEWIRQNVTAAAVDGTPNRGVEWVCPLCDEVNHAKEDGLATCSFCRRVYTLRSPEKVQEGPEPTPEGAERP